MAEWLVLGTLAVLAAGAVAVVTALHRRRARARRGEPGAATAGASGIAAMSPATGPMPAIDALAQGTPAAKAGTTAPHDDARTRLEINLAIAESALRSQRPRDPFIDEAGRLRAARAIRIIRTSDDDASWAELEPLTTSGEIFHLVNCARTIGGEFSAQSLMACAERLWCTRLARSDEAVRRAWRQVDRA